MAEHPMETTLRTALWRQVGHRRNAESRILRSIWSLPLRLVHAMFP